MSPIFQIGQKKGSIGVIPCSNDKREVIASTVGAILGLEHFRTMNNDGIGWDVAWECVGGSEIGNRFGPLDTRVIVDKT